jgi:hemolysin III
VSAWIPHLSPQADGPLPADHAAAYARHKADEKANQLTHGAGFLLSLVGAAFLLHAVLRDGDRYQIIGCSVFGASLVALYAASTLSHSFEQIHLRHLFRTIDQVCIFLLIAGTYTPFGLYYLRGGFGMWLLGAVWFFALLGIFFKLFYTRLQNVATTFYVLLGWLPMIAIRQIIENVPLSVFAWVLAGGVSYTAGTYFLMRDERRLYFHAVWHLLVIAGSAFHYAAVLLYIANWRP